MPQAPKVSGDSWQCRGMGLPSRGLCLRDEGMHPSRAATKARTICTQCTEVVVICLREEMHLPIGGTKYEY
jgi:hypothetical protein